MAVLLIETRTGEILSAIVCKISSEAVSEVRSGSGGETVEAEEMKELCLASKYLLSTDRPTKKRNLRLSLGV